MNKITFNKKAVDYDLLIKLGTDKCWVRNLFILRKNYKKTSLLRDALHNKTIENLDKIYDSLENTVKKKNNISYKNNYYGVINKKENINENNDSDDSDDNSDDDYKLCFVDTHYSDSLHESLQEL